MSDIWKEARALGEFTDVHIPAEKIDDIEKLFASVGLSYEEIISDVGVAAEESVSSMSPRSVTDRQSHNKAISCISYEAYHICINYMLHIICRISNVTAYVMLHTLDIQILIISTMKNITGGKITKNGRLISSIDTRTLPRNLFMVIVLKDEN